jgi:acyl-CoA reductase-like NAD-dependent aldehyde dehydrogenase
MQIKDSVFIVTGASSGIGPWGGFKYSGVGREYGQYGIEAFLEPKAILEVA